MPHPVPPYYYQTLDWNRLVADYPPAPGYFDTVWKWPRERLVALQQQRLREAVQRAWQTPFYRRRWEKAGVRPDDIRTPADLPKLPFYTVDDIRDSIALDPPYGDYQGRAAAAAAEEPLRIFWSGGTTGDPRPTVYTQWDREAGAILTQRMYYLQGVRPGDVVMNSWAFSTHNGAWIYDHALHHWLGCLNITTGTGNVTATEKQLMFAHKYGVTTILSWADHLVYMANLARELGYDLQRDFKIRTLPTFGNPLPVKEAWGCPAYEAYGFHEVQVISAECDAHAGLHVFEDAFIVECVDVDTGQPLPDGETGNLVVTCLYKTGNQHIRYNIQDLCRIVSREPCACGGTHLRTDRFLGRSDTMVKLRGINVWPEGCGNVVNKDPRVTGEWFCYAETKKTPRGDVDELTIMVEHKAGIGDAGALRAQLEDRLKVEIGLRINVEVVGPDALRTLTGLGTDRPKPKRFEDRRIAQK
ncbi:MAG: phenylacetate--CoA ligase family protein [Betaproteobacteria bacterium]|nr:MAG: phenylacetate--CoA ligase family protein [Betaproteobacteria bacterium]